MGFGVWGLGFGVWVWVWGLGFRQLLSNNAVRAQHRPRQELKYVFGVPERWVRGSVREEVGSVGNGLVGRWLGVGFMHVGFRV